MLQDEIYVWADENEDTHKTSAVGFKEAVEELKISNRAVSKWETEVFPDAFQILISNHLLDGLSENPTDGWAFSTVSL